MQIRPPLQISPSRGRVLGILAAGLLFLGPLLPPGGAGPAAPVLPEYQVKALFLLNFTKYVDWPPAAFSRADSPFVIGIIGDSDIRQELKKAIATRTVNGRSVALQELSNEHDWAACHIIFISSSENGRLADILNKLKSLPVLTVGETGEFLRNGGIICVAKKDNRIRLEISLEAARQAKVEISSKLLSVADTVQ